jgi:hypothetical protein
MDAIERLLTLAGVKKKTKKYSTEVENCWHEVNDYLVNKMGLGTTNRGFRLLQRIKFALEVEGYKFRTHNHVSLPSTSTSAPMGVPKLNETTHIVCNGTVCTLLRARPPAGLGIDAVIHLSEYLRSKQAYRFSIRPKDKSKKRKSGQNMVLPKPVTWHRLQKFGLRIEQLIDENNRQVLESFRCEGIMAYSEDRKNFFVPNQEMCRRWLEGVDRMIDLSEER